MKSVKRVFKKKLSPYNLRSRKSAVPVVKASTPKVNREVQASLSEEENCTLLCELPYHSSSVHQSTHAIDLSKEIQSSKPSNGPRLSTAFSSPSQADSTNREVVNISIDQRREPPIVHPSSSKQTTPCGPREGSESSSLEDFSPIDSRHLQRGPQIALEVEEISEPEHEEPDPAQNSNFAHDSNPLINSQLICQGPLRDQDSISYKSPKQSTTKTRSDSVSSADSRYTESDGEREDSEDSESEEDESNELPRTPDKTEPEEIMDPHLIRTLTEALQRIGQQQQTSIVVPETIRIQPFRGLDGDDVVEWFEVFENRLKRRRIALDSEGALTELVLHLAGPAKDFYSDLTPDEKDTLENVKRIMIEHYSSKDHGYGQREYLLNRRQAPSETLDHYLTDICTKFRRLGLTNKEKMTYFLQGLRPEIRQLVYMKEPKTFAEAEKAARFAESISRAPQSSTAGNVTEHDLIAKLLDQKAAKDDNAILSKLDVLINGQNSKTGDDQIQSLVSRLNGLIDKATSQSTGQNPETKTASLAAYAEPNKRDSPDYMREIRRMEDKLEGLYRQMDARFKGLARRNPPSQVEQPRQRTREGQPICYTCGRVGHIQQNCNQRSSRETSNYDRFQPNQPRRQTKESYPPRSGYNQIQRRGELPSFNPRNPRMAALDENYDDGFVALLERNANNQTIPEENGKFLKINWSDVGSQIGKELTQQLTNTSHMAPEAIQQSPVKKSQLPIVLNEVPKPRSQSDQQTMEQNNERKAATADCSERKLPGKLETKSKPEIRQRLVTSLPGPSQPSGIQAYDQPQSQEKHNLSGTAPFPNAVRRTKSRITADTDVIVDLCTEGNIERSSDPDSSQPQQSPSAGSESTADNKDSLPECMPDTIQTTGETPPLAAEQCNITNKQAKPRDLTVTAQLNDQDIKLLVDTGAGMSVIDEQFAQEVYRGELPELQKSALVNVKTVSGDELPVLGKIKVILEIAGGKYPCELQIVKNLTYEAVLGRDFLRANGAVINLRQGTLQFDDSQSRGVNAASIATVSEANNKQTPELLKEIRRMENGFTEKLENLNQRVDRMNRLARRNSTVCYRCGRTGHIQYNCYSYYQPESPTQKQEDSQEFHAHYNQEENQRFATYPSARLSADSQYPREF